MDRFCLILLNYDINLNIGLDQAQFELNNNFMGIKNISKGSHLFNWSYKDEKFNKKNGFFIFFDKEDILILKYNRKNFDFEINDDIGQNESILELYLDKSLNNKLSNYPNNLKDLWSSTTNHINNDLINYINVNSTIYKNDILLDKEYNKKDIIFKLNYSEYNIKSNNIDKFSVLNNILELNYKDNNLSILGEVQISFVLFMILKHKKSIKNLKKLYYLFCESDLITNNKLILIIEFLKVFFDQLRQINKDLFYEIFDDDKLLKYSIKHLFEIYNNIDNKQVKDLLVYIKKLLKDFFNYEFNEILLNEDKIFINKINDDDELPIIIDENEKFISFN